MRPPPSQPPVLGLLDIGTSKIACLMVSRIPDALSGRDNTTVIGFGHQKSRGLKAGVIVDAEAVEDAVRATVAQAEHMAGVTLEDVILSAACGRLHSTHIAGNLQLDAETGRGRSVDARDIERLVEAGRAHIEGDDRAVLNANAIGCRVDDRYVSGLAIGATGRKVSLDVHVVSADRAPVRHMLHAAERCQLRVIAIAAGPLAGALAVSTIEERQLGIAVVELGAGTTGLTVFAHGNLVCAHVFPIGSNHLVFDLMRVLNIGITEAERIKKNYAIQSLAHPPSDETVLFQPRGDDHAKTTAVQTKQVTRATISDILTKRLSSLFGMVRPRLDQFAGAPVDDSTVILTGGGSLLSGLPGIATSSLGRHVRVGAPLAHTILPHALLHPAFATIAGLEIIARDPNSGLRLENLNATVATGAPMLRRSF